MPCRIRLDSAGEPRVTRLLPNQPSCFTVRPGANISQSVRFSYRSQAEAGDTASFGVAAARNRPRRKRILNIVDGVTGKATDKATCTRSHSGAGRREKEYAR